MTSNGQPKRTSALEESVFSFLVLRPTAQKVSDVVSGLRLLRDSRPHPVHVMHAIQNLIESGSVGNDAGYLYPKVGWL